jgi:hypothetical protein
MHRQILSPDQIALLPLLKMFAKTGFFLAGGTGIALYMGHRRSIDFDLFIGKPYKKETVRKKLLQSRWPVQKTLFEDEDQLDLLIAGVKITFLYYPYPVLPSVKLEKAISLPSLLDLASMKAFALGRRAKWKDYVDLYFVLKNHNSLLQIAENADRLFAGMFNEKLFREQLSFFDDIDYSEKLDFLPGQSVEDHPVKEFLLSQATAKL